MIFFLISSRFNLLICESIEWQITPLTTFVVVLLALSPCLIKAFKDPQPRKITRWVAYAYACGFLFGWHVHEKASLHFVIPLAVAAVQSLEDARHYFLLSIGILFLFMPLYFPLPASILRSFCTFSFQYYFCLMSIFCGSARLLF